MDGGDARAIRVFVSSTFRDMQQERDELVKRVFPRIRRLCRDRGVAFSEVDLRWGVTDEQAAEGAVLPICLAEIERTRPYFIGLVGQRYGWVPDEIPSDLAARLGWLTEDRGRSVTEMEILHGVLRDPDSAGHAFFYLRDPTWVDNLPEVERDTYMEVEATGRRRLADLRQRIRGSGHTVRDYQDPVALGDLVLADLAALVEERYPAAEQPSPRERAAEVHRVFSRSLTVAYVPRPELTASLEAHATGDGPPLLVTGEPGVGMSALVADWVAAREGTDRVVLHHVAADAAAGDPTAMVARLVTELDPVADGGLEEALPDDPVAWRSAMQQALGRVQDRVVVVIDGVEDLDEVHGARDLRWLPPQVPANVRMVLVSSGERPRRQVEHRGWPILEVPALTAQERHSMTVSYLAGFAKALDEEHLALTVDAERTGNARYLRILLDELRQHGDHFTLRPTIERLRGAATVDDLYEQVLARYESDFEGGRPGLTRDVFTALWAARRGLSEAELLDLVGHDGDPLPQAVWAPLHLAAEESLVSRDGLIALANPDIERAIEDRYLPDGTARRAAHARLATYFRGRDLDERVVDELAWQQVQAGDMVQLSETLADLAHTEAAYVRSPADLRRAWARAREAGVSMVDTYRAVLDDPASHEGRGTGQLVWALSRLLMDAGHVAESLELQRHLVSRAREHPAGRDEGPNGDRLLRAALLNLGATAWSLGRLEEAAAALTEALSRSRAAGDDPMTAAALGNLAMTRRDLGDTAGADASFAEEAALLRSLDDDHGLQASFGNRAELLRRQGRFDQALDLAERQEALCRGLGDDAGVARARAARATVLAERGDTTAALALTQEFVERARREGDTRGLAEGLLNLAATQLDAGDVAAATASAVQGEQIARQIGDPGLLARLLVVRAHSILPTGDWPTMERVAREAELTARQAGTDLQLALALGAVGTARREQDDRSGALECHREERDVAVRTGDPIAIARAESNLGNLAVADGRSQDAVAHFGAAEPAFREAGQLPQLAPLYANRAQLHHVAGRLAEATADYARAATVAAELGQPDVVTRWAQPGLQLAMQATDLAHLDVLWDAVATAARATGDDASLQRALGERAVALIGRAQAAGDTDVDHDLLDTCDHLLVEQEVICRRIGDTAGLASCAGNQAIVQRHRGDLEGALASLDEQQQLAQEAGSAQGVLFATANRGEVLGLLGRTAEALEALQWARQTAAQYGLTPMVQQLDGMIQGLQQRN